MSDRTAVVAFVLSLIGATYQMISYGVEFLIYTRYNYSYVFGVSGSMILIGTLVVFWAIGDLGDNRDSQNVAWPSIILAMGVANLGNLIIMWNTAGYVFLLGGQTLPVGVMLALSPPPLLLIAGGIFGFIALKHQRKISSLGIRSPS